MDSPCTLGRFPPPFAPEDLADATDSAPAHSLFFRLAWRSMEIAERDAEAGELARAEDGFLIAATSFGVAKKPWLEGLAILELAAVYRLRGFELPDWLACRTAALNLEAEAVEHFLDFLQLIEITPPDSTHLWELLEDVRTHRSDGNCPS